MSIEINKITNEKELRQREQVANLSTHTPEPSRRFNFTCYDDDDDDEERTISLSDIISRLPPSSPPVLPIEDPEDSLSMGDEHLSTIPKKESDEFIKSSVEDLVPIPSESEGTPESDSECNDFSPINILEGKSVTLSLFSLLSLDPFVEIPSGESKVHIEVLSVLWGNRLPIPDGSLPLSR
ncbi:hypothetical protein Tco_1216759 [Tanacetum coccineum]